MSLCDFHPSSCLRQQQQQQPATAAAAAATRRQDGKASSEFRLFAEWWHGSLLRVDDVRLLPVGDGNKCVT